MSNNRKDPAALKAEAARGRDYEDLIRRYGSLVGEYEMVTGHVAALLTVVEEELASLPHRSEDPDWLTEWWAKYQGLDERYSRLVQRFDELPNKQGPKLNELNRERANLGQKWRGEPSSFCSSLEQQLRDLPVARTALKDKLAEVKRKLDELNRKLAK